MMMSVVAVVMVMVVVVVFLETFLPILPILLVNAVKHTLIQCLLKVFVLKVTIVSAIPAGAGAVHTVVSYRV